MQLNLINEKAPCSTQSAINHAYPLEKPSSCASNSASHEQLSHLTSGINALFCTEPDLTPTGEYRSPTNVFVHILFCLAAYMPSKNNVAMKGVPYP